jgi:hypothetical protein
VTVPRLSYVDRADVVGALALPLQLDVRQRRPVGDRHFGHRVREIVRVADRGVRLEDGRLGVALDDDEVAGIHHPTRCHRVAHEEQVDRPIDRYILADVNDGSVHHVRRVERRERLPGLGEARDLADVLFENVWHLAPGAVEGQHAYSGRQTLQVRKPGIEAPVHERKRPPLVAPEAERGKIIAFDVPARGSQREKI